MYGNKFLQLLDSFRNRKITVLGDFLLDQYIIGNSTRVSREAPVIIVDYAETVNHPGGAANASQNIAALGAAVAAVGVVGNDREGEQLTGLLGSAGVDTGGILAHGSFETPVKLRIMAGELNAQKQQVARVDRSRRLNLDDGLREQLTLRLTVALESSDALLISDYAVGVTPGPLSDLAIEICRRKGIPVVVDSRFNLMDYSGATAATPNEVEAMEALGLKGGTGLGPGEMTRLLIERSGIESYVITRGSLGMFVRDAAGKTSEIGIIGSNEATDVTGAGDTVSALVTLSLSCGASLDDAARMATCAAAVVVMKRGTATASPDEVSKTIAASTPA